MLGCVANGLVSWQSRWRQTQSPVSAVYWTVPATSSPAAADDDDDDGDASSIHTYRQLISLFANDANVLTPGNLSTRCRMYTRTIPGYIMRHRLQYTPCINQH